MNKFMFIVLIKVVITLYPLKIKQYENECTVLCIL